MTTFISRCTKEGIYDSKKEIDSKYDILANKANEEILYNCREKNILLRVAKRINDFKKNNFDAIN